MVSVDDSSNGREVFLHVGESLKISLNENASTGFRWTIHSQPETLRESEAERAEGPKGPPGRAGVRNFYFEAVSQGSGELEMEYRRGWEHAAKPARRFKLRVRIQE
jgi:predicted secreted protein